MDRVASFGLTAYWNGQKESARNTMQDDLRGKFQFFKSFLIYIKTEKREKIKTIIGNIYNFLK